MVLRSMPIILKWEAQPCSMPTSTLSFVKNRHQYHSSCSQPCHPRLWDRSPASSSVACRPAVTLTRTLWMIMASCSCHLAKHSQSVWRLSWAFCRRIQPRIAQSTFYSKEALTRRWHLCWRCHKLECIRLVIHRQLVLLISHISVLLCDMIATWEEPQWLCHRDKNSFRSAGCIGNENSYKKRQRSAASWDALCRYWVYSLKLQTVALSSVIYYIFKLNY